jgi:DNA polymerase-4
MTGARQIIHLDMDAFYASVEALDDPSLAGRPVVVGGLGRRGVVSTASYEARAFGVHSAMPMAAALRLCPNGVYLQPRHGRYQEISRQIMDIFRRYTPLVEPLSLDEAFLDVSASLRLFGPAADIARRIKKEVRAETGLTVTAGVAAQKHLAKIASGLNKPDGLTVVEPGSELEFLRPLPLKKIWGVGQIMLKKLQALGLTTIGDLAALDGEFMARRFGRTGAQLWNLANGRDERAVEPESSTKSVGAEETFPYDLTGPDEIRTALLAQALEAAARLRRGGLRARTVTVKFRDGRFRTKTRAKTLPAATDLRDEICKTVLELYEKEKPCLGAMRLLGVSLSGLKTAGETAAAPPPVQASLFDPPAEDEAAPAPPEKSARLNQALDALADRFGPNAVRPASQIGRKIS